jgi:hypothetical protein
MTRYAFNVPYVDGLGLLSAAMVILWLRLMGFCPRELYGRALLTVSGYLRRPPDRAAENTLRAVFADIDRDLAGILGDRSRRLTSRWRPHPALTPR